MENGTATSTQVKLGNFNVQGDGSANFSTSSSTYVDVTGLTVTYTTGSTPERLFIWAGAMISGSANSSGNSVIVNINGSQNGYDGVFYTPGAGQWFIGERMLIFDAPASTGVTIKLQAKAGSGTITVENTSSYPTPYIRGFAINNS